MRRQTVGSSHVVVGRVMVGRWVVRLLCVDCCVRWSVSRVVGVGEGTYSGGIGVGDEGSVEIDQSYFGASVCVGLGCVVWVGSLLCQWIERRSYMWL